MAKKRGDEIRAIKCRQNYTDSEIKLISEFIINRRHAAMTAVETLKEQMALGESPGEFKQMIYWRWTASILDWLLQTITQSKGRRNATSKTVSKNKKPNAG